MAGARDRDDGTTNAMLFEGASISQLVKAFKMDARDVSRKMRNVQPCGERRGFPIYWLKDAAAALSPPKVSEEDILAYIGSMNFKNLPPALNKEVWNGLRARLRFEQEQGDLWLTERIQEVVATLMQTFRMGVLLMPDKLSRMEKLTPKAHEALRQFCDEMLADMQQRIAEAMESLEPMTPGLMDFTENGDESAVDVSTPSEEDEEL
jgi:hypothetical protein